MHLIGKQSRRAFLRHSAALSGLSLAPLGLSLGGIGAASAQSMGDFKALVCIFLNGGNDSHNMVVPYDDRSYASYATNRAGVGVAHDQLTATTLTSPSVRDGRQFALHPNMTDLKGLYDQNKVAIIGNTGLLSYPVTNRTQLQSGAVETPLYVGSHPDQVVNLLSAGPEQQNGTGWGGRMGDLLQSMNSGPTSICMSTAGSNSMETGESVLPISVGSDGIASFSYLNQIFDFGNPAGTAAFKALQREQPTNLIDKEWLATVKRSMDGSVILSSALAAQPAMSTVFEGNNSLASQLQVVARLIAVKSRLMQRRQIYFVQFSNFDHHGGLIDDHPRKMGQLSRAMASFYQATVELGVANQVTAFTTSDFGRTLTPNGGGGGSDHGWGAHHLVMGGAVKGGDIYGNIPEPILDTALDWGGGMTIPGVSTEEYYAPMASWMGVSSTDMQTVLPNIGRFARPNLGFMT